MLNKLIEYVLSSSTINEFHTEKKHKTRGTLNLWINSPYGTGKSSSVNPIVESKLGIIIQDYTMPGLIGTIKKDGLATMGDIRLLPNTTGILEEFQDVRMDSRKVLLSLMEDHRYTRTMGFEILKAEHVIRDGFGFVAEGTRIDIYVRASFIVFSMAYRTPSTLDLALLSRCIPVFLDTAKEEQTSLFVKGQKLNIGYDKVAKAREDLSNMSVAVSKKTRIDISEMYDYSTLKAENLTRAMWDYTRIAYLEGYFTGVNEINIDIIESISWLVRVQELGYAKRSLTKTAYEIYLFLLNQEEPMRSIKIADELKFSREYTSRMLSELIKKQLISKKEVSKEVVYYVE